METPTKSNKVHIGRKISRIREIRGIKQDFLAIELGVSQQTISKIEQSEEVEDVMLEKIAGVLGVSADAIKNFSEEVLIFHIQNMHDNASAYQYNYQCHYNPLDKVVELYERLLASEREKIEILKGK
ncbi:XRE family transcriptional regulator [Pedobacter psychrodurus]|uniref:XRE family transcriptional regulator n=1 Tax=Pedobacter psychrodurus TaxID=2530456 RepID=A0A4R0PKI3_9SPHI|nr:MULTISPECIES: helix-turn-helix transcriptional regulator [Pedobacter]MBB6238216.1 transcriptional regulator with XRE-family HTH domain [Pedobacter sp. AK013]RZK37575.1 MAG: XRE family transcriptional regulator [Pedobacter sp.]TCD18953.1 XRE family transcriptional regulator [Pedobacter psychrodurus]